MIMADDKTLWQWFQRNRHSRHWGSSNGCVVDLFDEI